MSIRWILSSSSIVIVLDSIGILIPDHFRSNWFDIFFLDEERKVNYPYVSELISKDKLTLSRSIIFAFIINGRYISDLRRFLYTVHVFPLCEEFIGIL